MKTVRIASLVEGQGEVKAFPILLRRICAEIDSNLNLILAPPFRRPFASIREVNGLESAINRVAALNPGYDIVVLIDSDDDCRKHLGNELVRRAKKARPDLYVSVVLAHREYEAWFLAAAESLAGKRNLKPDLSAPANPENIRDAKGWLCKQMPETKKYSPTVDQAPFSQGFDLELARTRSRSFQKLWKEVETILQAI